MSALLKFPALAEEVPVEFCARANARRYILRVAADGTVQVTLPRFGSRRFALRFVEQNAAWVSAELVRRRVVTGAWEAGGKFLFRGEWADLIVTESEGRRVVTWAGERIVLRAAAPRNLRAALLPALRRLALRDLALRVATWAERMAVKPGRLSIRDQRARWGSCSASGNISLNWRLIQMPSWVADSIVIHELAHLRELNHSRRFWAVVAAADPRWEEAEAWLKAHRPHLL